MKFKIEKTTLLEALNKAGKAVTGKVNNTLLEGLNISSEDGVMTFIGSDSSLTIKVVVTDFEDIEAGNIIVEPRILNEIIRKLPDEEITISTEESIMEIKSGKSNFKIGFTDGSEYPVLDSGVCEESITMNSTELKKSIKQVGFAASLDETRPILRGMYFEQEGQELNFVSLDGYRLAKKTITTDAEKSIKVVVDAKNILDCSRLMMDDVDVDIKFTRNYIVFEFENTTIASRLIEGTFVKYNSLIPTEFSINAKSNKAELLNSLERASLIGDNNNKLVKLFLENNKLSISAKSQLGNVEDEVEVDMNGDANLTIAFNVKYLLDALRVIESDEVVLKMTSSTSPCIIEGSDNGCNTHLILPVRLM